MIFRARRSQTPPAAAAHLLTLLASLVCSALWHHNAQALPFLPAIPKGTISVHLQPGTEGSAESLARLAFTLPVRVRHERHEVRFAPLDGLELPAEVRETAAPGAGEPGVVTLRGVERPDGDRGPWTVDLHAALDTEAGRNSLQVALEEPGGRVRAASSGSRFPAADGSVGFRARAYGQWNEDPVAVRVAWYALEEEGALRFVLENVPLR